MPICSSAEPPTLPAPLLKSLLASTKIALEHELVVSIFFTPHSTLSPAMLRTTWLDGLRGLGAAMVVLDHYFMSVSAETDIFKVIFRSYWADPPEDNRRFFQLPPLRLPFAGHSVVPMFFVISGYAVSLNFLRIRNDGSLSTFVRRLSSAVNRRILRIYIPIFVMTVVSQILFFCNLYQWRFDESSIQGRRPWTSPWSHITFVFGYMLDNMNIINLQYNTGINDQLWTMPIEFRGSCITYLTILALAFWKPQRRYLALGLIAVYWFYCGLWDVFAFIAGMYLAEKQVESETKEADGELGLPEDTPKVWKRLVTRTNIVRIQTIASFLVGFYLFCMTNDEPLPPGYGYLGLFRSSRWKGDQLVENKSWKTVGAVLLIYSISLSPLLQRPFDYAIPQYLGKNSFAIYLIHCSVYYLIQRPLQGLLWWIVARTSYPGTDEASNYPLPFAVAWIGTFLVAAAVIVGLSHVYTRFIDVKSVELAKKFEKWATQ